MKELKEMLAAGLPIFYAALTFAVLLFVAVVVVDWSIGQYIVKCPNCGEIYMDSGAVLWCSKLHTQRSTGFEQASLFEVFEWKITKPFSNKRIFGASHNYKTEGAEK